MGRFFGCFPLSSSLVICLLANFVYPLPCILLVASLGVFLCLIYFVFSSIQKKKKKKKKSYWRLMDLFRWFQL